MLVDNFVIVFVSLCLKFAYETISTKLKTSSLYLVLYFNACARLAFFGVPEVPLPDNSIRNSKQDLIYPLAVEKSLFSALFSYFPRSTERNILTIDKKRYHSNNSLSVDDQSDDCVNETANSIDPGAYSILKAPGLQHWFKNWQEMRRQTLTASTFGGAIGLWPKRRIQLWLEKIGAIESFTGNLATCWTNIKEEEAIARYKLITGNSVAFSRFQVYQDKNYPKSEDCLAASPDGIVVKSADGSSVRGVLEIKCPYFGGDMTLASPWKRVPLYYIPQAQGLMEILDCDWMHIYVWTPKGSSLFRLNRDVEYWLLLKEALSDFWWKHVHPARELCDKYVITNPRVELSSYVPEPRHELCTTIIHRSKWLVDQSELEFREDFSVKPTNSKRLFRNFQSEYRHIP